MASQSILIFHGIGDPRPELPAEERPYWISPDFFEEILTAVKFRSQRHSVLLTFDDGNASDLHAARRLASVGLEGKFYLLTGRFGQPHYLNRTDARDLQRAGFEVGLHGRGHVDWRRASDQDLAAETIDARADLSDAIGRPVTSAAIPFGAYNRRVINHLRRQDFDRIYTSDAGPARSKGLFRRRTAVMAHHRIDDIIALIEDRADMLARARRVVAPIIKRLR